MQSSRIAAAKNQDGGGLPPRFYFTELARPSCRAALFPSGGLRCFEGGRLTAFFDAGFFLVAGIVFTHMIRF